MVAFISRHFQFVTKLSKCWFKCTYPLRIWPWLLTGRFRLLFLQDPYCRPRWIHLSRVVEHPQQYLCLHFSFADRHRLGYRYLGLACLLAMYLDYRFNLIHLGLVSFKWLWKQRRLACYMIRYFVPKLIGLSDSNNYSNQEAWKDTQPEFLGIRYSLKWNFHFS